jgi:hypothetical protein
MAHKAWMSSSFTIAVYGNSNASLLQQRPDRDKKNLSLAVLLCFLCHEVREGTLEQGPVLWFLKYFRRKIQQKIGVFDSKQS